MASAAQKLKIGLVLDDSLDKTDGVQQYVLSIGGWLSRQGHEVHYLVGQTSRTDLPNVHSLSRNVNVRFNGNRMSVPLPASRRKLRQFLDEQQFDVLHVQMPYSPMLAQRLIMAAGPQTALLATFHIVAHTKLVDAANRALAVWTRRSRKRFDQILSVSIAAADFARATYGVNTMVLPNVIDYDRFHDAKLRLSKTDSLHILFFGRLVPRKGCLLLLQAIKLMQSDSDLPPYHVTIAGKGPLSDNLQRYVVENNLQKLVQFTGYVSEADKPQTYASADIAVFPSRGGESFGIVLLEAMASGQATVLAGDNSGYYSVMADQPKLLFDPYNANELANKLRYFLQDAAARQQMAAWGEHYAATFDTQTVGQQLISYYVKALQKRAKP